MKKAFVYLGLFFLLLCSVSVFAAGRDDFDDPKQIRIAYDVSDNVEYVGEALSGKAASGAFWRIRKLVYDVSGNLTNVYYADDSVDFNKIWDNRSSYTYD